MAPFTVTTIVPTTMCCAPGSDDRRCPERNIRANELDQYVFEQVRQALLDPQQLVAAERAVIAGAPDENELVATQLKRLDSAIDAKQRERTRLLDAYQAGLIELDELTRRTATLTARREQLTQEKDALTKRSAELATENRLRRGLAGFAERVAASLDELNFEGRQRLLRLVVEKVRVTGWRVEIHLTIPLPDQPPPDEHRPNDGPPDNDPKKPGPEPAEQLSSDMRLRSGPWGTTEREVPLSDAVQEATAGLCQESRRAPHPQWAGSAESSMRLAIFSDIHGQVGRLSACLDAIARVGADQLWCLGDAVDGLSARQPELMVACVRAIDDVCVKLAGNHEAWALQERALADAHEGLQVIERWNSANGVTFYGKDSELTGADRESQEVSMLALHLLQSTLVHINTPLLHISHPSSPTCAASHRCSGPTSTPTAPSTST